MFKCDKFVQIIVVIIVLIVNLNITLQSVDKNVSRDQPVNKNVTKESADNTMKKNRLKIKPDENGYCEGNFDFRNGPSYLSRIDNCSVIAGSLSIVLMHNTTDDFSNCTFPKLREITGYLLIYLVNKLETLEYMFPNLIVIRGESLYSHYALVLKDLDDMTEIGLKSLVRIQRGLVFISNCTQLCYVETINWNNITQGQISGWGNYVHSNSSRKICPTRTACPSCSACWSNQHCQLYDNSTNCHPECLGGCTNNTNAGCKICRTMSDEGLCVDKCPNTKYYYPIRRQCVTHDYCLSKKRIPFQGECRSECPSNYTNINSDNDAISNLTCFKCTLSCTKRCRGDTIESIGTAEKFLGCQKVFGSVSIQIRSFFVDTEKLLEKYLGDIEEITGSLEIAYSPALSTLNILRNLRIIHGRELIDNKFSIIIMFNQNLQQLWDLRLNGLQLLNGILLFHENSKLCLKEILNLQKVVKTNTSADYIDMRSNGYAESCITTNIQSDAKVLSPNTVMIKWQRFNMSSVYKMIGYVIYYKEAETQNVTYVGLESCDISGWSTKLLQNFTQHNETHEYNTTISELEQYTQYAYYVKTHVVNGSRENDMTNIEQGVSTIKYFETLPQLLTPPMVTVMRKTDRSLYLKWTPLLSDRERITHYRTDVFIQPDRHNFLDSRNYCIHPIDSIISTTVDNDLPYSMTSENCKHLRIPVGDNGDWFIEQQIECIHKEQFRKEKETGISRFIHQPTEHCDSNDDNQCYGSDKRPKRTTDGHLQTFDINTNDWLVHMDNSKSPNYLFNKTFPNYVYTGVIDGLKPFTLYTLRFFSCNEAGCSTYYMVNTRTVASSYADNIDFEVSIDSNDPNTVHLDFWEPEQPNGLTVAFLILIYDVTNMSSTERCITRKEHYHQHQRFTVTNLHRGRYGFRVASVSLAMNGSFSDYQFIDVHGAKSNTVTIVISIIVGFVMVAAIIILLRTYCTRFIRHHRMASLSISRQNIISSVDGDDQSLFFPED